MFHNWVAQELAKIKEEDCVEPEYVMNPKEDHIIGVMSGDLKKLFTLWRRTGQEARTAAKTVIEAAKQAMLELPSEFTKADLDDIDGKFNVLDANVCIAREREEAMKKAFWLSVRDEFPAVNDKSLAVGKGFQVAWTEDEKELINIGRRIIIPLL